MSSSTTPFSRAWDSAKSHPVEPIFSARVGQHYRAVGVRDGNQIVWYWIGSHAEYDRIIRRRP